MQNTAKASSQASNFGLRGNERQVMTLQNSHIHGRKVDSPKIYVNESETREVRPKTSAQGSRKVKNDKKPPHGTSDITRKQKGYKSASGTNKTPSGSCPTIFSALKFQNQQPQRIDFTFQNGKDDLDGAFTSTELENCQKARQSDRNQNENANKSTSRLQGTQLSKYQQSRQQAKLVRPKSIGISSRVQRKRHLSQSMYSGTASLKQAKLIQQLDSLIRSPVNQDTSGILNVSSAIANQLQNKSKLKPEQRERRTRSSDLNSRPSLAAASKKGMLLKNAKLNKSSVSNQRGETNRSSTARAQGNRQGSETASGQEQIKVSKIGDQRQNLSFDLENKENYPSNSSLLNQKNKLLASDRSKSLSAGRNKNGQQKKLKMHNKMSLSSLSRSSPNLKVETSGGSITKMLGKQYFVDGEQLMRIMSPGTPNKSDDPLKSLVSGGGQHHSETRKSTPNKNSNYRKKRESRHRLKSEDALKRTIDSKSGDRGQTNEKGGIQHQANLTETTFKKDENSSRHQYLENQLKQKRQAQELLKKFMEETQRKTDRDVQKTKAQEKVRLQQILNLRSKSKKKRSKSCISKIGEQVFSAREQAKEQSKESANQTCLLSDALSGSQKRTGQREVSCVVEINNLKKEINDEIRRERQGISQLPRSTQTPVAIKPTTEHRENLIVSKVNASTLNYTSLRLSDPRGLLKQQKKSEEHSKKEAKGKSNGDINHSKIRKYIERQKRKLQVKKSMEETITHEKHLKIKQTLFDLQIFTRTKERSTPQQISSGPLRLTAQSINIKKVQSTTGKSSTQQIQLLDHVRNHFPMKNLRPNHTTKALKKKRKPIVNFNESSNFDSIRDMVKHGFLDDDATASQLEGTQQDLNLLNEESANINIFSKQISPSISYNHKQRKSKSPAKTANHDITKEHPLKELKSKIVQQKQGLAGSAKGPSKRRQEEAIPAQNQKTQVTLTAHSNATANFRQSDFESLEPSKPAGNEDNKTSKFKSRSTPKTNSDQINNLYDQSATVARRKPDLELEQSLAATKIQKYIRGHLSRKQMPLFKQKGKQSSPLSAPMSEKNNTAQSIRKTMFIPSLDLQKINSSDSNTKKTYTVAPPISNKDSAIDSARSSSLFDRDSFQQIKQNRVVLPQQEQVEGIPEMIQIREENIRIKQEREQRNLQLQLSQNKVSPRTYNLRQRDFETWVQKEQEQVHDPVNKQKAVVKEWDKTEQYLRNAYQDHDQITKMLGSARSSQKSKQPPRQLIAEDILASSARTGLNSFRIDSQRQSHRAQENRITSLIYDRKDKQIGDKQDSSSNSRKQKDQNTGSVKLDHSSSQQSHNNQNSQNSESQRSYRSQDFEQDAHDDENVPDFDKVVVFNQTKNIPQIKTQLEEHTLNRVVSHKRLEEQTEADQKQNQGNRNSPKHLSKTDARSRLHDLIDDEEAELARLVMEVSPVGSEISRSALRDDLKESLRSDNFFLNKTDQGAQSPKDQHNSKNNNIRIEIGDDSQPNSQTFNNVLIGAVSPLSDASSNFGIQRGCMSLESSTSGENREKLQQVIAELQTEQDQFTNLNKDQVEYGEHLTNEIMQLLVAEMRLDFDFMVNRDAAQLLKLQQQQQQDQMGLQQLTGIKTDLFAIEKYVDEVVEEIKLNSVEFMKVLNAPMTKNHTTLLNQLQNTEIGSCEHFNQNFPQILPLDLYLTLEKRRKEVRELQMDQNVERSGAGSQTEMLRILIAECEHIHNKVLFDCINDSLIQFKPYGKDGDPLPWSRKNRRLKPTDDFTINEIFEIVKHDLFRWAITQAGTLPRREFVYRGVFDEELFSEIREKKLVALLGREMIENEPKWLNYEFEQAQVKIDVGDMILELMVTETIQFLSESGISIDDLVSHPLMKQAPQNEEQKSEKKPLEPYEAHILAQMGINGAQKQDSQDQSDNSKDSDFSRNEEEYNAYVDGDESAENYFDDDRS